MTQQPRTGSISQVNRLLIDLMTSPLFAAELAALAAQEATSLTYQLVDASGVKTAFDVADRAYADMTWVKPFATAISTEGLSPKPPYPCLVVLSGRPRLARATAGDFEDLGFAGWEWDADLVAVVQANRPEDSQREAQMLCDAMARLLGRNESLGGLVERIHAAAPTVPGGLAGHRVDGLLAAAVLRCQVQSLRVW